MSENAFSHLRSHLDSNDPFVSGGHGEIQTSGATRHAERMKRVPVWVDDDEKIRELLLLAFPKLQTNAKQKQSALMWMKIIQLYWRTGKTTEQVAHETGMSVKRVENYLWSIKKVVSGKDARGRSRGGKRGRPKNSQGIQATSGNDDIDSHISL